MRLFRRRETTELDVPQRGGSAPSGDAERLREFDFRTDRQPMSDVLEVDDLLFADPGFNLLFRHADFDRIPLLVVERMERGGFVLRGVGIVDARQSDRAATPTADDKAERMFADGKRQAAEEIAAVGPHRFQRNLVIHFGKRLRVGDAGHVVADVKSEQTVFDAHFPLAAELRHLPTVERLAVEQFNNLRLSDRFGRRGNHGDRWQKRQDNPETQHKGKAVHGLSP